METRKTLHPTGVGLRSGSHGLDRRGRTLPSVQLAGGEAGSPVGSFGAQAAESLLKNAKSPGQFMLGLEPVFVADSIPQEVTSSSHEQAGRPSFSHGSSKEG